MKKTALRFMVCSDLHYGGPDCREKQRFEEGLRQLYAYADGQEYSRVDAVYIVGAFATDGTLGQMKLVKESLDRGIRPGTAVNLSMASHEYHEPHGEEGARRFFAEVFGQPADTHRVIGGFHFISVSVTEDNHFREPQIAFARRELEAARADGYTKFIMFLHYPPTSVLEKNSAFTALAEKYGAEQVVYAHCHGEHRFHDSLEGRHHGILYRLASGDYLTWEPAQIL